MHHSSTSTYIWNVIEIYEPFLDVRTGGLTFDTHFIRSTRMSHPENVVVD